MPESRPRSPQGSGSRRKGVSSPQGASLKPTPAFRHHTLVAMEMGEHGLGALVTPPEAASASLDCTQFKKAWRGGLHCACSVPPLLPPYLPLISKIPLGNQRSGVLRMEVLAQHAGSCVDHVHAGNGAEHLREGRLGKMSGEVKHDPLSR